jgi:hypothetical protein
MVEPWTPTEVRASIADRVARQAREALALGPALRAAATRRAADAPTRSARDVYDEQIPSGFVRAFSLGGA